jgi:hypothetical protein
MLVGRPVEGSIGGFLGALEDLARDRKPPWSLVEALVLS